MMVEVKPSVKTQSCNRIRHDSSEYLGLTGLRGVAAITVLFCHAKFSKVLPSFGSTEKFFDWSRPAVDLFFMLSGVVLVLRYYSPPSFSIREYLRARIARVFPLQWFAIAVVLMMEIAWSLCRESWDQRFTWQTGLKQALLVHRWPILGYNAGAWNPPSWSLSVEWFVYLFVIPPLIIVARQGCLEKNRIVMLILVVLFVSMSTWGLMYESDLGNITSGLIRGCCGCASGILLICSLRAHQGLLPAWYPAVGLLTVFVTSFLQVNSALLVPLSAMMIGLTIAANGRGGILESSGLVWLGRVSYSIYLLHWPLLHVVQRCGYYRWLSKQPIIIGYAGCLAIILAIVLISGLSYRYIELHFRNKLRNRNI